MRTECPKSWEIDNDFLEEAGFGLGPKGSEKVALQQRGCWERGGTRVDSVGCVWGPLVPIGFGFSP